VLITLHREVTSTALRWSMSRSCIILASLNTCSSLPQLHALPHDPFDPQFVPRLEEVTAFMDSCRELPHADAMSKHQLAMGVIPAYLQRLDACSFSGTPPPADASPCVGDPAAGTPPAAPHPGVPPASAVQPGLEDFCSSMCHLLTHLPAVAFEGGEYMHVGGAGDGYESPLLAMEQLLSSTDTLAGVLQRGLAAQVQQAARSGSAAARGCMGAVAYLFRFAARALFTHAIVWPNDRRWVSNLSAQLHAFLNLEEALPYLELLCLPQDSGEMWWRIA
jgi:hypothetical protein